MEESSVITKEEGEARERFRTNLVRLSKQVTEQKAGNGPDLSMIPPHLMHKR
jgi:hypothetical protein